MKKLLVLILTLVCLTVSSLTWAAAKKPLFTPKQSGSLTELDIYSINDFRGHIFEDDNYPGAVRLSGVLQNFGAQNYLGTVYLGGANMLGGPDPSDKLNGMATITMMNNMAITADVAGSRTFAYTRDQLRSQKSSSYFSTLAANVLDKDGKVAVPFKPWVILTRSGVDIGVIGLVNSGAAQKVKPENLQGMTIVPPEEVAQKNIDQVRKLGAKVVILLTSLGSAGQGGQPVTGGVTELLDKVTGVDGVITGETGNITAGTYKGIPVVQSGINGQAISRIHILYSKKEKKVVGSEARFYDIEALPVAVDMGLAKTFDKMMPDANVVDGIKACSKGATLHKTTQKGVFLVTGAKWNKNAPKSGPVRLPEAPKAITAGDLLAIADQPLTNDKAGHSLLGEYCTSALQKAFAADVVLYDGDSFEHGLADGDVTDKSIEYILGKKEKHIIVTHLSGKDIRAAVEHGMDPGLSLIRFAGLSVTANLKNKKGQRVEKITLADGQPLELDKMYKVVTNDFMMKGGDGYTMMAHGKGAADMGKQFDFFKYAFKSFRHLTYTSDNRFHY
jgi:5'-nucleotidase/UDP-sugar diphosphatase